MTINFTIFIQAIHFFLAYLIIVKLFIKPSLGIIVLQEMQDRELLLELNDQAKKFEQKNNYKINLWKESLVKFSFYTYDIDKIKKSFKIVPQMPKVSRPSEVVIASLKKETLIFLKDRISHVK